jgi:hypothetical protein
MGQLDITLFQYSNVANVGETDSKVNTNTHCCKLNVSLKETRDNVYILFIVEVKFINCLAGLMKQWIV